MKQLMLLLNLLLCFELTVGSMPEAWAQQSSCPAGLQFDSALNRCLTSAQTAQIMNATRSCPAGDVKCYRENAETALKGKEESGEVKAQVKSKGNMAINAAAVALPLLLAAKGLKGSSPCQAPSHIAMIAGGASLFVGDLLSTSQHKKRLKQIEKDWNSIVKPDATKETNGDNKRVNATEAQSQAFEMLARSEDSLEKAAKMKSLFFGVSMGAFAASAVLATLEIIHPFGICKSAKSSIPGSNDRMISENRIDLKFIVKNEQTLKNILDAKDFSSYLILVNSWESSFSAKSSPSIDEYEKIQFFLEGTGIDKDENILRSVKSMTLTLWNNISPLNTAFAAPIPIPVEPLGEAASQAASTTVKKSMIMPAARAILSGVLAAWSYTMYSHAKKQAKVSKERAELLRKMRDEFNQASGAINSCTSNERSNPGSPTCYCYTPEGQRNPARSNSQVCIKLFTGKNLTGVKELAQSANGAPKGCVSSKGQFDEKCTCKTSGSCLKATPTNLQGFNPGSFSMLSSALTPIDKIGNGTAGSGNVSGDASVNTALRLLDAQKKLENKKELAKFKAGKSKLQKQIEGSLLASGGGASPNFLGNSSSSMPTSPGQAASLLEKEIEDKSSGRSSVTSGESLSIPSGSPQGEQLEFGMTNDQLADQETQIAEVMQQNLDYGTNDINNGSSASIFEQLSNRYQRSGMRRLFEKDGKSVPEKPAESDISNQ